MHPVVIEGDPNISDDIKGIAYLTSTDGKKVGLNDIAGPENIMLSPTQPLSGENIPQFAIPIIPPIILKTDQYIISVEIKLDQISEHVSQYQAVSYEPEGITIERLNELNNLSDLVIQTKSNHKEVD